MSYNPTTYGYAPGSDHYRGKRGDYAREARADKAEAVRDSYKADRWSDDDRAAYIRDGVCPYCRCDGGFREWDLVPVSCDLEWDERSGEFTESSSGYDDPIWDAGAPDPDNHITCRNYCGATWRTREELAAGKPRAGTYPFEPSQTPEPEEEEPETIGHGPDCPEPDCWCEGRYWTVADEEEAIR